MKKRFYLWHFFIFIPILIIINVLDVDKMLQKIGEKPIEITNYEKLYEDSYTIFDVASGDEIGEIEFTEMIASENMTFDFQGRNTFGSRYGFEKIGNHDFDELNIQKFTLEKALNDTELYWIGNNDNLNVIMINLFSDDKSIPDNLKDQNRKFYLIRFVSGKYFDFIGKSDSKITLRESLSSSSYEGRYSAIFFIDVPAE